MKKMGYDLDLDEGFNFDRVVEFHYSLFVVPKRKNFDCYNKKIPIKPTRSIPAHSLESSEWNFDNNVGYVS